MEGYIYIGKIVNTHGIRGDVKVYPYTSDVKRFEKLKEICIEGEDNPVEIERVWYSKNMVMLKLKGYNNINEVLKFKEKAIMIPESDAVELKEDEYFLYQLKGIEVFDTDGNYIGVVKEVLQPGANDVYVVKNGRKEYLIPGAKEIVPVIDVKNKKMIVKVIEGLLE